VEARKDTTVVIHPLADDRRVLPMEKLGELLEAPDTFCLAISYNPGYQSVLKDLKQSTRQRFVALEFDYPGSALEQRIVEKESGDRRGASPPAREVRPHDPQPQGPGPGRGGLHPAPGPRRQAHGLGRRPGGGLPASIAQALTDDPDMLTAVNELSASLF
jgi:nitric oxide reductase NorQ protein